MLIHRSTPLCHSSYLSLGGEPHPTPHRGRKGLRTLFLEARAVMLLLASVLELCVELRAEMPQHRRLLNAESALRLARLVPSRHNSTMGAARNKPSYSNKEPRHPLMMKGNLSPLPLPSNLTAFPNYPPCTSPGKQCSQPSQQNQMLTAWSPQIPQVQSLITNNRCGRSRATSAEHQEPSQRAKGAENRIL